MITARLAQESLMIGAAFTVLFFVVHVPSMSVWKDKAMTHHGFVALQVFATAVIGHIVFEFTGTNTKYCKAKIQ